VISREALEFMKALRETGYAVSVDPDDGTALSYSTEKGLRAFLSDPLYIVLIGIPLGIVVNIISNWLYERFKKVPSAEQASIILEIDEHGVRSRYDHNGRPMSEKRFESILGMFERRAKRYAESQAIEPPDPTRPVPLFLEHTTKLVGWGRARLDEKGLRLEDIKIIHKKTLKAMKRADLEGLSIAGLVYDSVCSICERQYIDCNHIAGKEYDGRKCLNRIDGILLAETSLVKQPIQPKARIESKRTNKIRARKPKKS
jgi:phage head maturation protease